MLVVAQPAMPPAHAAAKWANRILKQPMQQSSEQDRKRGGRKNGQSNRNGKAKQSGRAKPSRQQLKARCEEGRKRACKRLKMMQR